MGEFYWSGTSISTTKHIGNFWFFYVFSDTNNFIKVRGKSGCSFSWKDSETTGQIAMKFGT